MEVQKGPSTVEEMRQIPRLISCHLSVEKAIRPRIEPRIRMTGESKDCVRLDKWVDLSRNTVVVLYAIVVAYFAFIQIDIDQFFWTLVLIGGAIIYALYLPYKFAGLIKGELGVVARAKVLQRIIVGIAVWASLTALFMWDQSLAQIIPMWLADPSSADLTRLLAALLLVAIIAANFTFNVGLDRILVMVGYNEDEARHLSRYLRSRGLRDVFMTFLMIFYSVSFIVSGWVNRGQDEVAMGLFGAGIAYAILLILYGFFYVWYTPERYISKYRMPVEGVAILVLLTSPRSPVFSILLLLGVLTFLAVRTRKHDAIDIQSILEREEEEIREIKESLLGRILELFFQEHREITRAYFVLLLVVYSVVMAFWFLDIVSFLFLLLLLLGMVAAFLLVAVAWVVHLAYASDNLNVET